MEVVVEIFRACQRAKVRWRSLPPPVTAFITYTKINNYFYDTEQSKLVYTCYGQCLITIVDISNYKVLSKLDMYLDGYSFFM